MVIDHHQIGRLRTLARLHHEALAIERAFGAQAVVDGGGHHRQQRRVVGQGFEFGHVAGLGAPAPGHDALELRDLFGRGKARLTARLLGAVLAQIVGAALQQRATQAHAQRGAHARQIAMEQLILQRARAGGNDGLEPGQQRRHQIGVGLAGAGAGLCQQHIALLECLGNRSGQAQLRSTWREGVELTRKRPTLAERFDADSGKLGHETKRKAQRKRDSLARAQ